MRAEILCVGSELLLGQIVDTNAAYIGRQLARAGIDLNRKQTVGDNLERIIDCIKSALLRTDVLIITGGLGPTTDDLTREAIAGAMGVPLEFHPELEAGLREFFKKFNATPGESTLRQAYLPQGTIELPNPVGTAPGVDATTSDGKRIFAVPGVPREMIAMLDGGIIPILLQSIEGTPSVIVSRVLRAFGVGESGLADPIEDILTTAENPTVAPLIYQNTEVHLRLTAKAADEAAAKVLLDDMETRVRARKGVGEYIFGTDDQTLPAIVVEMLRERGQTVAVAESVTGGLIQALLTEVAGSSTVFKGGVVAYFAEAKQKMLGVSPLTIEKNGIVSQAVAQEMASGVRDLMSADWSLSTTGEAGPQAASDAPVGTIWIGLDGVAPQQIKRELHGDREAIKKRAALWAIDTLRRQLLTG